MKNIPVFILLLILGFLVYGNSLQNESVWDDKIQLVESRHLYTLQNIPNFFTIGQVNGYYRPFFLIYLTAIFTLFGDQVFFFHIFQVLLHIGSAVFIYLIFKRFFKKHIALFLSVIFLVHPMNTEAVSYISAVQDTLVVFFGLLGLYLALDPKIKIPRALCISTLLLFALLSKESALLFVIAITLFWILFKKRQWYLLCLSTLPALAGYCMLRFAAAGIFFNHIGYIPIMQLSLPERLLLMPKIFFYYVKTFFFPIHLAIDQHWILPAVGFQHVYFPLLISGVFVSSLCALGVFIYKKRRELLRPYIFFFLWFFFGVGFYLQIIPLDMTVAERWFYGPMIGLLGIGGIAMQLARIKNRHMHLAINVSAILLVLVLGTRTVIRNTDWKDALTLYSHDSKVSKDSYNLESNLGNELYNAGRYNEAKQHLERSVILAPNWWGNWNNLGNVYEAKNDYKRAKMSYLKAISNNKQFDVAYNNLAYAMLKNNETIQAKQLLLSAVKMFPENPRLVLLLSIAEYKLGNKKTALLYAEMVHKASPTKLSEYVYNRIQQNEPVILEQ